MKTKILRLLCLVTVLVISTSQAQSGLPCSDDSDCAVGYCCQILNPNPLVSKRRKFFSTTYPTTGTCERYLTQGETCGYLDKANGYCSCGPGLKCTNHPPKTTPAFYKRRPLPGTYDCQPAPTT